MIKIARHVPLPQFARDGKSMEREACERLEVGESFYTTKSGKAVRPMIWAVSQRTSRKFVTRKEDDGVRVWRAE